MSIFSRIAPLTHHRSHQEAEPAPPCAHRQLVPLWDSVADLGKKDKITRYKCDHCHETFTPEQAEALTGTGTH